MTPETRPTRPNWREGFIVAGIMICTVIGTAGAVASAYFDYQTYKATRQHCEEFRAYVATHKDCAPVPQVRAGL